MHESKVYVEPILHESTDTIKFKTLTYLFHVQVMFMNAFGIDTSISTLLADGVGYLKIKPTSFMKYF
jgi:hypothetical protein